jgi:hypothetical protein
MVRLTSPHIQLEEFNANALRSPHSVVCCHLLDQADCLGRQFRLARARLGFALPDHAEELTMPAQQRLWLEKVEGLFPGPNHSGQEYQEKPVRLFVYGSFDLSMEDGELLS